MSVAEAGAPMQRRERRIRRLSLAAVVLLIPVGFAVSSRLNFQDFLTSRELLVSDVRAGESAPYAGAEWRVAGFKALTDSSNPRLALPPDQALVLVRLTASVKRDLGEGWSICRLTLVDEEGRRWKPLSFSLPRDLRRVLEPDGKALPNCGSVSLKQPKAGAQELIEERFLVPRSALAKLFVRLSVVSERPRALSFELRPD